MKPERILFIVLDGLGDHACKELDGLTPLEKAYSNNVKKLKENGSQGLMDIISPGIPPSSDVSHLIMFGYDVENEYFGRGPIEALGEGVELKEGEIAFRGNLATVRFENNYPIVVDRRAGRITSEQTKELVEYLNSEIECPEGCKVVFKPLSEHRFVMIVSGEGLSHEVTDNDPHAEGKPILLCQPIDEAKDRKGAERLAKIVNEITIQAIDKLSKHELNKKRAESKLPQANSILVRSAGTMRKMKSFQEKWDLKAACVAAGLLYRGVAKAVGMDVYDVEGANGLLNTNIQGKTSKALELLKSYDFVYLHFKGTDVASHSKNPIAKCEFIRRFYESLNLIDDAVLNTVTIVITGDHTTPCDRGMHTGEPVPILIASKGLRNDATKFFSEREAVSGGLGRIRGKDIMPILLDSIERTVEYGTRPSPKKINYMPKSLEYLKLSI
ncbi:MAG: 2,3-bisphosphoglycerate-independent phosphoglycerate mutase [Candidatus Brockarchaeota archaeon]|nr:2,3-bisphosphoglycerate-independent phosphoglycerate mutase [Candidatus Brockarchaeota archaeon]